MAGKRQPPPTKKARAEESPQETLKRVMLEHKSIAYGPNHPLRCECGTVLAEPGIFMARHELHVDHIIHSLTKDGVTWRN